MPWLCSAFADIYSDEGKNRINGTTVIFSTDSRFRVLTDSYTSAGYVDFYTLDENKNITSYNGEETIVSSVLWTLRESRGAAYMTIGHGETANYSLYTILTAAGYDVKDINLRKSDVPEDAWIIPSMSFSISTKAP